jgi:hypothetical protein
MYYVIGADGKMNGPLSAEDVHQWLAEGRANKYSRVRREDDATWQPLSTIPELAPRPEQTAAHGPAAVRPQSPEAIAAEYLRRGVTLDAGRCVARAWALVKINPVVLVSAAVVAWSIVGVLAYLPTYLPSIGWVAGTLVNGPMLGGLDYVYLRRIRGEQAGTEDVFAGFRFAFAPLLLAAVVCGGLTALGLLLIAPGIYLAVGYIFVLPLVIDKRMEVWTAMEVSRRVVHQQWWTTFALALVAAMIALAGLLAFGVGLLVAVPVATATVMYAYEDLFGRE